MVDIQWTIILGIIATNKHRVHCDPTTGVGGVGGVIFCSQTESLEHLVLTCPRLGELFDFVKDLGENFRIPKHTPRNKNIIVLLNFIFANEMKMAAKTGW